MADYRFKNDLDYMPSNLPKMRPLVERLRALTPKDSGYAEIGREAANEIEWLRRVVLRLRTAAKRNAARRH
jgi:hypothetical protein